MNHDQNVAMLNQINKMDKFDLRFKFSCDDDVNDSISPNPYIDQNHVCKFYDEKSLVHRFASNEESLFLNMNIRSLAKNFPHLKEWILTLNNSVSFDVIALQEIWQVQYTEEFDLPGYQPIVYKTRSTARGGGVALFIKKGIKFKIIDQFSIFHERVFESICIELTYPSKKRMNVMSIYRPPGNHPTLSSSDQLNEFLQTFNSLCSAIANQSKTCIIMIDSNIDLL